jgi:monothiol glutaredoxin
MAGLETTGGSRHLALIEQIQAMVEQYPMILFMKGTPQWPMCGFSSRAVQALQAAGADRLQTVNVLEDAELRANLPRFSNLPTFPQFFIHGELIGGSDIIIELLEAGELQRIVAEAGQA